MRCEDAFEIAPLPVIKIALNAQRGLDVVYANAAFRSTAGSDAQTPFRWRVQRGEQQLAHAMATGKPWKGSITLTADTRVLAFKCRAAMIGDGCAVVYLEWPGVGDPVEGFCATTHEAADRLLMRIMAAAPDGVVIIDSSCRIVAANQGMEEIFETPVNDLMGRRVEDLMPQRFRASHAQAVQGFAHSASAARRMGERGRIVGLRKSGVEFSAEASIVRVNTPEGPVFAAIIRDVSEQEAQRQKLEQSERRLRRSEMRLRKAQRIASLGNWCWDMRTGWFLWSDEVRRMLRVAPAGRFSRFEDFLRRIHPADRPRVEAVMNAAIKSGTSVALDCRIVCPDDEQGFIRLEAEVIRDECGKPQQLEGIVQDITERKHTEERLQRASEAAEAANRAKSRFLATMSHELRTPLNAVIGFSEVLAEEVYGPIENDRYKEYVHDILLSGRQLLDLINDILDLSKVEAGKMQIEEEVVELAPLAETAVRSLAEQARRRDIAIECDIPSTTVILADRRVCRQILLNLLSNAVKFSRPGGKVVVDAEQGADGVLCLKVSDQGIGLCEDELPKVTEAFYKAGNQCLSEQAGSGLGLSLVKLFAELHGGALDIESALDVGTTVMVCFPPERSHPALTRIA